jgi:hypothetical protein
MIIFNFVNYITSNGWKILNDELKSIRKEAVVAYFKEIFRYLHEEI